VIRIIFADQGAGKTTYLAKIIKLETRKMKMGKSPYKHIICNSPIEGAIFFEDIRKLLKRYAVEDTLMLIDEGSIVYNNRKMDMTAQEIPIYT
jgi:hypothetical protein